MNLWIRTQDKRQLIKVDRLCFHIEGEFWGIFENDETPYYLGLYATQERAEKVLDEIQEIIEMQIASGFWGFVYQMPED